MNLNPLQMQVLNHFRSKIEEQNSKMSKAKVELTKVQQELPPLVQKIHENELTRNVI